MTVGDIFRAERNLIMTRMSYLENAWLFMMSHIVESQTGRVRFYGHDREKGAIISLIF